MSSGKGTSSVTGKETEENPGAGCKKYRPYIRHNLRF